VDTGIFDQDRYFDVFVEYAKAAPTDILIQTSICNRGSDQSVVQVLPTLWFRNIWTWWPDQPKPSLKAASGTNGAGAIAAADTAFGDYVLHCEGDARLLFTENDTNNERLFGSPNPTPYVKDGIHNYVVAGRPAAVNLNHTGTKAAAHYQLSVGWHDLALLHDHVPAPPVRNVSAIRSAS